MTRQQPLRFGIIGDADIYRRRFLPAMQATGSACMEMLGSRKADVPDTRIGVETKPAQGSYDQVLNAPDIDLVYIALPNHLHEEWTIRALQAGKHVICEKPLGLDLASVQRMVAVARSEGRLLYENITYLHHPQHRMVREMVATGAIGTIRQLRANFCFTQTKMDDFRLNPALGGGSFQDQARYPLTAALYHLSGQLDRFHGTARYRDQLDVAVTGSAISSAGELFTFTIAFDQPYEAFYEIIGDHGFIRLDRAYTTPAELANSITITSGDRVEIRSVPPADHFHLMIEHVCRLITSGQDFAAEHHLIEERAATAERMRRGCLRSLS